MLITFQNVLQPPSKKIPTYTFFQSYVKWLLKYWLADKWLRHGHSLSVRSGKLRLEWVDQNGDDLWLLGDHDSRCDNRLRNARRYQARRRLLLTLLNSTDNIVKKSKLHLVK